MAMPPLQPGSAKDTLRKIGSGEMELEDNIKFAFFLRDVLSDIKIDTGGFDRKIFPPLLTKIIIFIANHGDYNRLSKNKKEMIGVYALVLNDIFEIIVANAKGEEDALQLTLEELQRLPSSDLIVRLPQFVLYTPAGNTVNPEIFQMMLGYIKSKRMPYAQENINEAVRELAYTRTATSGLIGEYILLGKDTPRGEYVPHVGIGTISKLIPEVKSEVKAPSPLKRFIALVGSFFYRIKQLIKQAATIFGGSEGSIAKAKSIDRPFIHRDRFIGMLEQSEVVEARNIKEIFNILLENGADINSRGINGDTALMCAAENGNIEVVKLLLGCEKIDVNKQNLSDDSALIIAIKHRHTEVAELLINSGRADVDIKCKREGGYYGEYHYDTALMYAIRSGNTKIVQLLLKKGAKVDAQNTEGNTALMCAAENGNIEIVKLLLDYKADVNVQHKNGNSALIISIEQGHTEVAELLINSGRANVDINGGGVGGYHGDTALMHAIRSGNTKIVQLLLKKEAKVDAQNTEGYTALIRAVEKGDIKTVKLLLENKANVNLQNHYGHTALMMAAAPKTIEIVKLLLANNADVNVKDKNGETALMRAARRGDVEIVKLLLEYKADPRIVDKENHNASFYNCKNLAEKIWDRFGFVILDLTYPPEAKKKLSKIQKLLSEAESSLKKSESKIDHKSGQHSPSAPTIKH